ncbi:MAG: YkvA family protein [Bacteroidia bacterium]
MSNKKRTIKSKNGGNIDEILGSPVFNQLSSKARQYINNPGKVIQVLGGVTKKIEKGALTELKDSIYILARMIKAVVKKQYKHLPTATLVRIVGAMLYFLFIADLIPDFIPVLGLMDDATVLAWVISSVRTDISAFEEWEKEIQDLKGKKALGQIG